MVVHKDKLRWLFWLRWKLLLRGYTRGSGRVSTIIGSVVLLLFSLVFGGGLAVGTFFGYRFAPAPYNSEILALVLTGVYLLWLVSPLMQISTNEGLDVSKLSLFPLTRWELMVSLLFSTLFDVWTIFLVFLLGAVVIGWAFSLPLALFALLAVLVFYVQIVGIGQLVMALLSRLLQSRRLRDLSVVLVILVSISGYLCNFALRGSAFLNLAGFMEHGTFLSYLQWLPPGMAARAIQQASVGNWGISFAWLGALLVLSVLALYLWSLVVERGLTAPETGGVQRVRSGRAQAAGTQATAKRVFGGPLVDQVLAITGKELKYFRRDPQFLRLIVLPLFYVVFLILSTIYGSKNIDQISSWRLLATPALILLSLYSLSYNTLGFERQSLTTLFLFPIDPKRILWGKNLVVFALGIVELVAVILLVSFITHAWDYALLSFTMGLAGICVVVGWGNVTSVFFPQRMRQAQRGFQSSANMSAESGILRFVLSLLALASTIVVLLPVFMALLLPLFFHAQWIWTVAIPASLVYGAAFYYVVTALVASRMVARTPEILAVVAKE
ncbi:MAG TPA: hypothetical protein VKR06_18140 [Ktedonosporobacter sp.]|nr:hypothetical protein [Ktedonosporobacter sp.]